jgi:hypothetical protein
MKRIILALLSLVILTTTTGATWFGSRFPVASDHDAITLSNGGTCPCIKHITVSAGYTIYLGGILVTDALVGTVIISGLVNEVGTASTATIPVNASGVFPFFDVPLTGLDNTFTLSNNTDGAKVVVFFRVIKSGKDVTPGNGIIRK